MKRMSSRTRGFTLVEVLVALLILTIVITTSLGIMFDRHRRLAEAAAVTLAWQAIANEAEARRHQSFAALHPGLETTFMTDLSLLAPLGGVTTRVGVTAEPGGIRRLDLRVAWDGGKRVAEAVVFRSHTGGTSLW